MVCWKFDVVFLSEKQGIRSEKSLVTCFAVIVYLKSVSMYSVLPEVHQNLPTHEFAV